jgi:peroxiredoxin
VIHHLHSQKHTPEFPIRSSTLVFIHIIVSDYCPFSSAEIASVSAGGAMPQIATMPIHQEIGAAASDFRLPMLNGQTATLKALLEGKRGAAIVFWSGVCSHCARYDGYLNSFADRHPELGFLTIASRKGETQEQIRKTVKERNLLFPIACDSSSLVARQWSTQQTPRAFLVESNRVLLYRGAIDNYKYPDDMEFAPYLEPAINQFLSGKPLSRTEIASFGCAINSVYYNFPKAL